MGIVIEVDVPDSLAEYKEELLTKDVRTTRHLTTEALVQRYEQEGASEVLPEMLKKTSGEYVSHSDVKYAEEIEKQKSKKHVWTFAEDEFIRKNYQHLSDNTIGLALNLPGRMIMSRRQRLKLYKGQVKELNKVIVWCKRTDFDEICQQFELTKARG
jgi:hypothetical protein